MPGCGKTTLIKQIIAESGIECAGFYTEEIRERNQRTGFRIEFIGGSTGILAKKGVVSEYKVGPYGVDIERFNDLLDKEKLNIHKCSFVIIDEIGKMELFSEKFRELINSILEGDSFLLASIMYKPHPFADMIKSRKDVRIFYLERKNFNNVKGQILGLLNRNIP